MAMTNPQDPYKSEMKTEPLTLVERKTFRWLLFPTLFLVIPGLLICVLVLLHFYDVFLRALLADKLTIRDISKLLGVYAFCIGGGCCFMLAGYSAFTGKYKRAWLLCLGVGPILLSLAYLALKA